MFMKKSHIILIIATSLATTIPACKSVDLRQRMLYPAPTPTLSYTLYNVAGQVVYKGYDKIDYDTIPPGVYFETCENGTRKIVK